MGLRDIIIKRTTIDLGDGQSFEVRGLTAMDVMAIVQTHGKALALAFGKIKSGTGGPMTEDTVRAMLVTAGSDLPEVLSAVIALAANAYDEGGLKIASEIPFTTQMNAALEIFRLSFASETEVKKLMDSLSGVMVKMASSLTMELPSLSGISGSAAE